MKKIVTRSIIVISFIIVLIVNNCGSNIPDFSDQINYDYKAITYYGNPFYKDIKSYKYYNKVGKLIEEVSREHRTKFYYDSTGQLVEVFNCRMYDSQNGYRTMIIKDTCGNFIGTYYTPDDSIDLDTAKVEQIKFYNKDNLLCRELIDRGRDYLGHLYEVWKYYSYVNNKVIYEVEMTNDDTTWIGKYEYDYYGNLAKIYRQKGNKYEIEKFKYDRSKRLIQKSIENNKYLLSEDVSFSPKNNLTIFKYDNQGRLTEEVTYNHKGEEFSKLVYVYDKK